MFKHLAHLGAMYWQKREFRREKFIIGSQGSIENRIITNRFSAHSPVAKPTHLVEEPELDRPILFESGPVPPVSRKKLPILTYKTR